MAAASEQHDLGLPKNVIKRIVKERLAGAEGGKAEVQINKEALLAFGESAKVFISYVTATANDVAKEGKRATISADDVFQALEDLEFGELLPQLKDAFEVFKQQSNEKKEKAAASRKRKSEAQDAAAAAGGGGAHSEAGDEPADTTAASDKSGGDAMGKPAAAGAAAGAAASAAARRADKQPQHTEDDEDMVD